MPAQEMIVVDADLARLVVVADIVVVGLRQRYVNHAENQHADPQGSCATPISPPPRCHDSASFLLGRGSFEAAVVKRDRRDRPSNSTFTPVIMREFQGRVKLARGERRAVSSCHGRKYTTRGPK